MATFDVDRLLDYRSRRPIMTFDTDRWVECDSPELAVYAAKDATGTPFLVLSGPEPDREWELFTAAVGALVDPAERQQTGHRCTASRWRSRTPGRSASPVHASRPELITGQTSSFGRVQVPGSVAALIEFRLGAKGHDALGYAVHVPHYLSRPNTRTPRSTALEAVTRGTGLVFPLDALREAAQRPRPRSRSRSRRPRSCPPPSPAWSSSTTRSRAAPIARA